METYEDSAELLHAFRQASGPAERAHVSEQLYTRYAARLVGLAKQLLSKELAGKVDAEDIVQSAYKSFFRRVEDGRFQLIDGKLWSLLASVTHHKVLSQAQHFEAQKRQVSREEAFSDLEVLAANPSPDHVTAFVEEVEEFLSLAADPLHRKMLTMALQGYTASEIGAETRRTATRVRQVLQHHKERLEDLAAGLRVVERDIGGSQP